VPHTKRLGLHDRVFGQNLTDRTALSNTWVMPFSTLAVGSLRPPRTFGLRVSARY